MKLHVGCGTVYLRGYVNVDVPAPGVFLATERPDLVADYETDEENYYSRHAWAGVCERIVQGRAAGGRPYVCDRYGTWETLPCRPGEAQEILGRQCFEHLSSTEATAAVRSAWTALAPSGHLRLSVPDHEATMRAWKATGDPLYLRHCLGPRSGGRGFHMMAHTLASLRSVVECVGFTFEREEPNPHDYPSICAIWRKP